MSEKKKEKPTDVNFAIQGIEVSGLSINKPDTLPLTFEFYAFNISIEYRLIPTEKVVLATLKVEVIDTKSNFCAGSLNINVAYVIGNFEEVILTDKDNKQLVPQSLADVINSITISTSRGILHSEFKGTYLHNLVMPIVDPKLVAQVMKSK